MFVGVVGLCLLTVAVLLLLIAYIQILYECVRKVRIAKYSKSDSGSIKCENLRIEEYKQAPGPLPWPILGNLALLGRFAVPFQGFTELAKEYGAVYTLTLGSTRCLVVNNLELIREVLNQNGKYFGGRPDFQRFHILFGGDRNNSLALCDWSLLQQKRRNLARKHCSPRDASSYHQKMSEVGCIEMLEFMDRLAQTVKSEKEFKLKPLVQRTCANMFCQYMCSVRFDYDDIDFQGIVQSFDEIFWEINQGYAVDFLPWLSPFYSSHMKKIMNWSNTIRKFILERIIDVRERLINVDDPEKDFTDALLKSLIEDNDVSRNTIIFMLEDFIGGHSAVGNLVMLSLAYIVRNPQVGKEIQREIDNIIGGESNRSVTLSDIDQMPYTMATMYEVLRHSSSPIVPHVATEDVAIGGYGVTKGTLVFINNYALNYSNSFWTNPQEFNPERFLETVTVPKYGTNELSEQIVQLKKNIPHFLPFSIGKRTCIGQNLVKGFGFIMLANVMYKYDVSCSDINSIKTYPACLAVPPDTFSLNLTPRRSNNYKN